jgi:arylsulfatase A
MIRTQRWLLDGRGRFFDCGELRDEQGYRDVTDSDDPEVAAAKERLQSILDKRFPLDDFESDPVISAKWKKVRPNFDAGRQKQDSNLEKFGEHLNYHE